MDEFKAGMQTHRPKLEMVLDGLENWPKMTPQIRLFLFAPGNLVGGNSNVIYVQPETWGFMIQFDGPHIFQMGWFNHHLGMHWEYPRMF